MALKEIELKERLLAGVRQVYRELPVDRCRY